MHRALTALASLPPLRWLVEVSDAIDGAWDVTDPLLRADDGA